MLTGKPFTRDAAGVVANLVMAVACWALAAAMAPTAAGQDTAADKDSVELPVRLLDRPPFDRVTLDAANGNAVLETVLLDLAVRRIPENLPREGELELRQLSQPSIPYVVAWTAIAKIELYEQMLLEEAARLTAAGEFREAFEYFSFLSTNYPQLAGLEEARQDYLWREASATFAAGKREEVWPILLSLYARNPEFPRLASAIQAVSDRLITERIEAGDYAAARAVLDMLERNLDRLELSNVARWRQRFAADAQEQLAKARAALADQDYSTAREAARYAAAIQPQDAGAHELLQEIQTTAPEIRVGVTALGRPAPVSQTPDWQSERVGRLADPRLVELVDFGAEGGLYECRYGQVATSDSGVETTLLLSDDALRLGLTPDVVALELADAARDDSPHGDPAFAVNLQSLAIADGAKLRITWRRPPIRPEAFLQTPLRWLTDGTRGAGLWFELAPRSPDSDEARYVRTGPKNAAGGKPRYIVERIYDDDDAALAALAAGEVDAVDRVPPWQLDRLSAARDIVVSPYRLPTVHVLVPNRQNALFDLRDFRRALCYAIDREGIVRDILLGGQSTPGFRALSAPLPAGVAFNDPVGYAYNPDLAPRPYEPRLAAVLASVARTTLAKREAEARKVEQPAASDTPGAKKSAAKGSGAADSSAAGDVDPRDMPPPKPLRLAHAADPIARLACQSIKLQLDQVGIPVKLVELPARSPDAAVEYDLLYAELAVWEPLVDARRIVGARGTAGRPSALMDAALDRLDAAENLKEAQQQLHEIHRIAHYDLPVIPLWQTVNHFARRAELDGVGDSPVSLYQNVAEWRKVFP